MKRSEMVEILYKHLVFYGEPRNKFYKTVDSPLKRELADILLRELEKAGMLPPPIQKTMGETFGLSKDDSEYDLPCRINSYEWEPENE